MDSCVQEEKVRIGYHRSPEAMLTPTVANHTGHEGVFSELRTRRIVGAICIATLPNSILPVKPPHQDEWDKQIEEDVEAGKLDQLAQEAKQDYQAGETTPL